MTTQNETAIQKQEDNKIKNLEKILKPQMRLFCQYYTSYESELFGNGVNSYALAYKVDKSKPNWYRSAAASAGNLLKKAKILDYINALLGDLVLNDAFVDKQIGMLITQNADFGSKMGAIREYNQLKGRIQRKLDAQTNVQINVTNYIGGEQVKRLPAEIIDNDDTVVV